ncbi:branched-chain amino acid ABC transporter permease [Dactylosporangium sp. CA-092794]|uniref:branched-chain amino acid ABC transporter permease n=1 Tax=Dactylosporangium sp. CA-092794 TaxID=3239929 RepID=UPI003D8C9832
MSDVIVSPRARLVRRLGVPAALLAAVFLPVLYADSATLQMGLFVCSAAIAAIALNLLFGVGGQLNLGHGFFVAIGAYGYAILSGHGRSGAGLPTWLAAILATALAGLAGLLFSPISARVKGIYLGIATLALVFLGQYILINADTYTGGFNGRPVEPLSLGPLRFSDDSGLALGAIPLGQYEMLWLLGVPLVAATWWFAQGIVDGRPGRALMVMRDNEVAAAVLGVDVRRARRDAFVVSSLIAGLAGVLYALSVGQIVPDSFGLTLSVDYLAMVVIGGLASMGGSVVGALVVTGIPLILTRYSASVPVLSDGGLTANTVSQFFYGGLVIVLMIFEPNGLAAVLKRTAPRRGLPANDHREPVPATEGV